MNTKLVIIFLFLLLTFESNSQMESNIVNRKQEQIEQLYDPDNDELMFIQPGGSLPFSLNLIGNTIFIPIKSNRVYNINQIRIVVYLFFDEEGTGVAYPKWEQFAMILNLTADIVDANFNPVGLSLFNKLKTDITDGITSNIIFNQPFIFKTTSTSGSLIRLQIDPTGSVFTSLSGITIPPPAGLIGITVKGTIFLEGVSYSLNMGAIDEQKNESTAAAAGIEVDNAIDIDI